MEGEAAAGRRFRGMRKHQAGNNLLGACGERPEKAAPRARGWGEGARHSSRWPCPGKGSRGPKSRAQLPSSQARAGLSEVGNILSHPGASAEKRSGRKDDVDDGHDRRAEGDMHGCCSGACPGCSPISNLCIRLSRQTGPPIWWDRRKNVRPTNGEEIGDRRSAAEGLGPRRCRVRPPCSRSNPLLLSRASSTSSPRV